MKKTVCSMVLYFVFALLLTASCEKGYYVETPDNTEKTEKPSKAEDTDNKDDSGKTGGTSDDRGNDDNGSGEDNAGDNEDNGSGNDDSGSGSDENGQGNNDDNGNTGGNGESENTDDYDALTVGQFLNKTLTGQWWVCGYIVGACSVTINNADFEPPFEYPQALLLADSPNEKDNEKVITIGLPSGSRARRELNLVDNPENLGKRLLVFGEQTTYLRVKGIKKPDGWELKDK